MLADTTRTERRGVPPSTAVMVGLYTLLAIAGLVGMWYFNLQFSGDGGQTYLQAWFANPASSSAAVDVMVTAVAACLFYLREGSRLGWRWTVVALIPLTFLVALAFTFPLFLALRELRLRGATTTDQTE